MPLSGVGLGPGIQGRLAFRPVIAADMQLSVEHPAGGRQLGCPSARPDSIQQRSAVQGDRGILVTRLENTVMPGWSWRGMPVPCGRQKMPRENASFSWMWW